MNPDRKVEVSWTTDGDGTKYPVRLSIRTEDRTGLLADITATVSNVGTNIIDARAQVMDGGDGLIEITMEVDATKHLEKIIGYLKRIGGVLDIDRQTSSGGPAVRDAIP